MESSQSPVNTEKKNLTPNESRRKMTRAAIYVAAVQRTQKSAAAEAEKAEGTSREKLMEDKEAERRKLKDLELAGSWSWQ